MLQQTEITVGGKDLAINVAVCRYNGDTCCENQKKGLKIMENGECKVSRAIIADDEILKAMDIKKALAFNRIFDVKIVSSQEKLWEEIYQSSQEGRQIDLIVSDMQYPLIKGGEPDEESGLKLIARLGEEGIKIPVIICSRINYTAIPEAFGCVWYNQLNDLEAAFQKALGK